MFVLHAKKKSHVTFFRHKRVKVKSTWVKISNILSVLLCHPDVISPLIMSVDQSSAKLCCDCQHSRQGDYFFLLKPVFIVLYIYINEMSSSALNAAAEVNRQS